MSWMAGMLGKTATGVLGGGDAQIPVLGVMPKFTDVGCQTDFDCEI